VIARVTRWIGVVLIVTGVAWIGAWFWWMGTRVWDPLDVPVSLASGHVRTAEFEVNVESEYSIGILLAEQQYPTEETQCRLGLYLCSATAAPVRVRWTLLKGKQAVYEGSSEAWRSWLSRGDRRGAALSEVRLSTGKYILELKSLSDGSFLDAHAPHLMAFESGGLSGDYAQEQDALIFRFLLVILLVLSFFGCRLLFQAVGNWRESGQAAAARWSLTQAGPAMALPESRMVSAEVAARRRLCGRLALRVQHAKMKQPFQWPFCRPSWSSQILVIVFLALHMSTQFIDATAKLTPKGLVVRLVQPGVPLQPSPGIQPVLVHVSPVPGTWQTALSVNGQPVAHENLEAVLRQELKLRPPDWPVYVEGERDLDWGSVGRVIDVAQGLHARVVLLTARSR
jgi:hypothetical protein